MRVHQAPPRTRDRPYRAQWYSCQIRPLFNSGWVAQMDRGRWRLDGKDRFGLISAPGRRRFYRHLPRRPILPIHQGSLPDRVRRAGPASLGLART